VEGEAAGKNGRKAAPLKTKGAAPGTLKRESVISNQRSVIRRRKKERPKTQVPNTGTWGTRLTCSFAAAVENDTASDLVLDLPDEEDEGKHDV
jgi:hypothetical protein